MQYSCIKKSSFWFAYICFDLIASIFFSIIISTIETFNVPISFPLLLISNFLLCVSQGIFECLILIICFNTLVSLFLHVDSIDFNIINVYLNIENFSWCNTNHFFDYILSFDFNRYTAHCYRCTFIFSIRIVYNITTACFQ